MPGGEGASGGKVRYLIRFYRKIPRSHAHRGIDYALYACQLCQTPT